uniref:Putative amino acid transporter n=1 Tax=Trypanosoma vivax (strain Y486) TaxID=1055687 RepID=G0U7R8_TRYVY|nr:putative amino acid transporter, fragment [Trypanosoma vivax Y486]
MSSVCDPLLAGSASGRMSRSHLHCRSNASRISAMVAERLSVVGAASEKRQGSAAGAAVNTLCNVIGAGVLSLPLALYEASIVGGLVLMVYTALMAGFGAFFVVIGCETSQRFSFTEVMSFTLFPSRTFEEFCSSRGTPVNEAHSSSGGTSRMDALRDQHKEDEIVRRKRRRLITVLLELAVFLNNYGALIIYSRVISDSIPPVIHTLFNTDGLFVTRAFWLVTSGIIFFVLSCVRHMDELKWTSLLGFLTIFYIVVIVVLRFFTSRQSVPYPDIKPEQYGDINWTHLGTGIFRTMSTYGVAFGYHYNIPYFYRELKCRTPVNMMKSVYISFPIIFVCYAATGFFGYLTFGNLVADPKCGGDIVRNFYDDDFLANIGRLGLFLHFACVYPILSVCARRGLHRLVMHALMWKKLTLRFEGREEEEDDDDEMLLGGPSVSISVVLAATISGISVVIDVIGALFGAFLMLTGPGLLGWYAFSSTQLLGVLACRHARLFTCITLLLIATGVVFTVAGAWYVIGQYLFHH